MKKDDEKRLRYFQRNNEENCDDVTIHKQLDPDCIYDMVTTRSGCVQCNLVLDKLHASLNISPML